VLGGDPQRLGLFRSEFHSCGDPERQLVVGIDDHELSLDEFGRVLRTYAGWGMRREFVPEDEIHRRPAHEVREPEPEEE
jgi:hypothetical protein